MNEPGLRHTPALWVATRTVGEADALVQFFTPHDGALQIKARGLLKAQSKLAGLLQPADELQLSLAGRGDTPILAGVSVAHSNAWWRDSLDRLALAWFFAECAYTGSGTEPQNVAVYQLAANLLRTRPEHALPAAASVFALKLLALHGLLPDLEQCCVDGTAIPPAEPAFLLPSGEGLVSRAAYNRRYARSAPGMQRLEPAQRERWRTLLRGPLLEYAAVGAEAQDAALLCGQLARALSDAANRKLVSWDFLRRQWKL